MGVKLEGAFTDIVRIKTGYFSFDYAMNGGMPGQAIYELYGPSQSGKTTLSTHLSALTRPKGRVVFMEIEGRVNPEYVRRNVELAGFGGSVLLLPKTKQKDLTHEYLLNELLEAFGEEATVGGILDSTGALMSKAQIAGKIGEAFIGKEAKLVWQSLRKAVYRLNRGRSVGAPPANLFLVSHTRAVIGAQMKGVTTTSGGTAPDFLSTVRIKLKRAWNSLEKDGSFVVEGKVQKLTYGPSNRVFKVFLLTEHGIHPGLTAMTDCDEMDLVERKSQGVFIGKANIGRIGTLLAAAKAGDEEKFAPFVEVLRVLEESGDRKAAVAAGVAIAPAKKRKKKKKAAKKGRKK